MDSLQKSVVGIVSLALSEDLGDGDVTSDALIPPGLKGRSQIVARAAGVIAGLPVVAEVFRQVDPEILFHKQVADGDQVSAGAVVAEVTGPVRGLLAGERVALNFLQRLSGVATLTRRCVDAVKGYPARILDTRKTTPGLRSLEKYAVRMGGGTNHRIGLYDQILIKDNHLAALLTEAGDIEGAVRLAVKRAREHVQGRMLVEVETESLEMVSAAIEAEADIILLDNMPVETMAAAVLLVREHRNVLGTDRPTTEASGGVKPEELRRIAATGVDAISLGLLTHSAPALDLAMNFD
jgi:nicotinate-nucleotide pyrophosphorylase (carboxylating)